jgi:hypothetical protein
MMFYTLPQLESHVLYARGRELRPKSAMTNAVRCGALGAPGHSARPGIQTQFHHMAARWCSCAVSCFCAAADKGRRRENGCAGTLYWTRAAVQVLWYFEKFLILTQILGVENFL